MLVGEGIEILKHLARKGPCSSYKLESKWSSRTVTKQLKRLRQENRGKPREVLGEGRLVEKVEDGYRLTDYGFFELIPQVKGSERKEFIKRAIDAYPGGMAHQTYGWMLKEDTRVSNVGEIADTYLRKGNFFLICRTDMEGRIVWRHLLFPALDSKTGRFNLRLLEKHHEKWKPVQIK